MIQPTRPQSSYDLHLHTYWSYDAHAEPARYLEKAAALGMRCLAITEHHNLDSQQEVFAAAKNYPSIRILRAAELTVETSIGSVDLVCLGFLEIWPEALVRLMERYHRWQVECGTALCRGMQALGYAYTDQDRETLLQSYRPTRTLAVQGLTHVKNGVQRDHFVQQGFLASQEDYGPLMERLRNEKMLPSYPPAAEVIPVVHAAGAVVSIAHPPVYFNGADPARMDTLREECDLDGIECAHTRVGLELTEVYHQYCRRHDLLSTAGTDCHTDEDIDNMLGRHGGQERWFDELLERLG